MLSIYTASLKVNIITMISVKFKLYKRIAATLFENSIMSIMQSHWFIRYDLVGYLENNVKKDLDIAKI